MTTSDKHWDGYVRIPTSALATIPLHHLVSEKDPTICVAGDEDGRISVTGHTEWTGTWNGQAVSIGWDWGVLQGVIVLINATEIRTNILLIAEDGRPERPPMAHIHFLHWLEQVSWRQTGIEALLK